MRPRVEIVAIGTLLHFDYLDPGCGFVVGATVVDGDQNTTLDLPGSAKGVTEVNKIIIPRGMLDLSGLLPTRVNRRMSHIHREWFMVTIVLAAAATGLGLAGAAIVEFMREGASESCLGYAAGGATYLAITGLCLARLRGVRRVPRRLSKSLLTSPIE